MRPLKTNVYASDFEKVQLACEVKSNPQSIIEWYYEKRRLTTANYKYNITKSHIRKFDYTYLDDMENVDSFVSTLTVNSLNRNDYGEYSCMSNNAIGGNSRIVQLKQKSKFCYFD